MKKLIFRNISILILILITAFFSIASAVDKDDGSQSNSAESYFLAANNSYSPLPAAQSDYEGPELERYYFERWHYPLGVNLPKKETERIWREIEALPDEKNSGPMSVNSWSLLGPAGMNVTGSSQKWSGRVLDIKVDGPNLQLASATGGLWQAAFIFPVPKSDNLNTMSIAAFDAKPGDENTIFVGTGEFEVGTPSYQQNGTGLWKTTNGGTNWTNIPLAGSPNGFFKIRYDPSNINRIYAATTYGFFVSNDGGSSWSSRLGNYFVSDFTVFPANNTVIAAVWGVGLVKSTDGGTLFSPFTGTGLPTTNIGRTSISVCNGQTSIMYVSMGRNDNDQTLGVYKTTTGGATWTNVTPNVSFLGSQAWYTNVIGVSPTDPNMVLAGGVWLWRSTNGGTTWTQFQDAQNVHADEHRIVWKDGTTVYLCNDGGFHVSTDAGATWSNSSNFFPVTQFTYMAAGGVNKALIFGGTRDNGEVGTTNSGTVWTSTFYGDGGSVCIDPGNNSRMWITGGAYNGALAFHRLISINSGSTWTDVNNGIDPSTEFYPAIRNDRVPPVYLFTNSGPYVEESVNSGTQWLRLGGISLPCINMMNINTAFYSAALGECVYAALYNNPPTANKLRVYDNTAWFERSTGFPAGSLVRQVAVHPTNPSVAYALINGTGTPGQKIFKTTNRGVSWTNISGDFPDVPIGDLVPHPTDDTKLYAGTEFGCYKSSNSGTNWVRWNNGMPIANVVTEMGYIDSTSLPSGKFYIVAASYGRGIWMRDISGDDPIGIHNNQNGIPKDFSLSQNYPNPFNPETNIDFSLPLKSNVEINVYDINGRLVTMLVNEERSAGYYSVKFNAAKLSSGIYFYRIVTDKFSATKKMILVK